ncbi:MAG: class I SAM-dependent methyltransferase [Pseudomonadota bacterium]
MSGASIGLNADLQEYLLDVSLHEPGLCQELREQTESLEASMMISSAEQVQLLSLLIKLMGAENAIEVGTFTGYTSLRLAMENPCLQMLCCDVSEEYTDIAREYWGRGGVSDRIDLRLAPALETLDALIDQNRGGNFDFAYIDADKSNYRHYVERCMILVRSGGLIALDNTLWGGAVADPDNRDDDTLALRQLNSWLYAPEDLKFDLSLVPIGDGLTLLRKH